MFCIPRPYDDVKWSGRKADAPIHTKGYNQYVEKIRVKPKNGMGVPGVDIMKRDPHNKANRIWAGCFDANKHRSGFKKGDAEIKNKFVARPPLPTLNPDFQAKLRNNLGMSLTNAISVSNHEGVC